MKKYVKLICIEVNDSPSGRKAGQSNKFYEMIYEGGDVFTVNYGRVDVSKTTEIYPIKRWDEKYKDKIKKGYKDVTEFVAEKTNVSLQKIGNEKLDELFSLLEKYQNNLISNTYSVKAQNITLAQIQEAQKLLDYLLLLYKNKAPENQINEELIKLYSIIPRYMSDVRACLLPIVNFNNLIEKEQDNIDAVKGFVEMNTTSSNTILQSLDIKAEWIENWENIEEIKYLTTQPLQEKIINVYRLEKESENKSFNSYGEAKNRILIHGTRCSSVLSILKSSLKIRPTGNFHYSGSVYGQGIYFSETMRKSLNYTGYDKDKFILVYEVKVGNPFVYEGWYTGNSFILNRENLKERGFDSTFVKAGNGLLNSEIIVYTENQQKLRYLIQLQ